MAIVAATEMIRRDQGVSKAPARIADPMTELVRVAPPIASLARGMAGAILSRGYQRREDILACIDDCLVAGFSHCGEKIDLERDLSEIRPGEPDVDKHPEWIPPLRPKTKCQVGKHMAKNDIDSDWLQSLAPSITGRARVSFVSPDSSARSQITLDEWIGPPTRYSHLPETIAENLAHKIRNQTGDYQLYGGPFHDPYPQYRPVEIPRMKHPSPTKPSTPSAPALPPALRGRPYMAGEARFTTMVREAEWVGGEPAYAYANCNPTTYTDPSGLKPTYTPPWMTSGGHDSPAYTLFMRCAQDAAILLPGCAGKDITKLVHELRCIAGCETADPPSMFNPFITDNGQRYASNGQGIGPCRLTTQNQYPLPGWQRDYCTNAWGGMSLLCSRGPSPWTGSTPECLARCMREKYKNR